MHDALADCSAGLGAFGAAEFVECDGRRLDVQIDPIEQRAGDSLAIFFHLLRQAAALPFRIPVEAARAWIRCPQDTHFKKVKGYPENPTTIGEMIRKRRLDLNLRQTDVAKIIGCNQMTVVNWEKGYTQSRVNHMAGVTRFLGFNPIPKGETLAQRIANYRKAQGTTQQEFAAQLGIDPSTLARWEREEREPRGRFALKLNERLRTVAVLCARDGESGWQILP